MNTVCFRLWWWSEAWWLTVPEPDTGAEQITGQEPPDPLHQDFLTGVQRHSYQMAGSFSDTPDLQVSSSFRSSGKIWKPGKIAVIILKF